MEKCIFFGQDEADSNIKDQSVEMNQNWCMKYSLSLFFNFTLAIHSFLWVDFIMLWADHFFSCYYCMNFSLFILMYLIQVQEAIFHQNWIFMLCAWLQYGFSWYPRKALIYCFYHFITFTNWELGKNGKKAFF